MNELGRNRGYCKGALDPARPSATWSRHLPRLRCGERIRCRRRGVFSYFGAERSGNCTGGGDTATTSI